MDVPELSLRDVLVVPVKEGKEVSYYSPSNIPSFVLYENINGHEPVLN